MSKLSTGSLKLFALTIARQISVIAGFFRHTFWRHRNEAHISALEDPPCAAPWLSGAHADARWTGRDQRSPGQRARTSGCVNAVRATLPPTARLSGGDQFTGAFERRIGGQRFQILARPNRTGGSARLGIVVGRRTAPRAVDRARARRIIREAFRSNRSRLGSFDVVVRVKTLVSAAVRLQAREEIKGLFARVATCAD